MSKLLNVQQAAERLSLPASTLNRWRSDGRLGPQFGKFGRRVFYREEDIDAWVAEQFSAHGPSAA